MSGSNSAVPEASARYPAAIAALIFAVLLMFASTGQWTYGQAGTSHALGVATFVLALGVAAIAGALLVPGLIADSRRWTVAGLALSYAAAAAMLVAVFTLADGFRSNLFGLDGGGNFYHYHYHYHPAPGAGTAELWTATVAALGCAIAMSLLFVSRKAVHKVTPAAFGVMFSFIAIAATAMTWTQGYEWSRTGLEYTHGWIALGVACVAFAIAAATFAKVLDEQWRTRLGLCAGALMVVVAASFFVREILVGAWVDSGILVFCFVPRPFTPQSICGGTPVAGAGFFGYAAASAGYLSVAVAA